MCPFCPDCLIQGIDLLLPLAILLLRDLDDGFPGSPAFGGQMRGLLGLHDCMSQFL